MLMRKLLIRPEAEAEIVEAHNWYKLQAEGLSSEFLRAVEACLSSIEREPFAYPVVHKQVRRALLRKFPYGIFFIHEPIDEENEHIVVLACFHARRDPKQWQERAT
jgi:plasmid stabilization system protein ParE